MIIKKRGEKRPDLTFYDLEPGTVFEFIDDSKPNPLCIKIANQRSLYLDNGTVTFSSFTVSDGSFNGCPVRVHGKMIGVIVG